MDQVELRRQLREQLDATQREQARLAKLRKRMQYEWAEEEAPLEARVTEINRQLHETRRAITFPLMSQKLAELSRCPPGRFCFAHERAYQRIVERWRTESTGSP